MMVDISEGMDLIVRPEQANKNQKHRSSMSLYRFPAKNVAQIKDESFHLKVDLLDSNDLIKKKISHGCVQCFAF